MFTSWPADAWRPDVEVDKALAVYGVIVSLESFDTATSDYDWPADEVESWWATTVSGLVLK